nr:hypothetical protein 1 [Paracoccaceae bacterium]
MKDRSDFNRSGYGSQLSAYKRARAYNAQERTLRNRQQRTTTQTPGTGGFSEGIGIQQQRYREVGKENDQIAANRPDMDNSLYDIYQTNNPGNPDSEINRP